MTFDEFIKKHNIKMFLKEGAPVNDSFKNCTGYTLKLMYKTNSYKKHVMTTYFYMGSALNRQPVLTDVLYSLSLDAHSSLSSFEEFCSEFLYNIDSIRDYNVWKACVKHRRKLQKFLNSSFEEFMQCEE